jgi:hypothetical protein
VDAFGEIKGLIESYKKDRESQKSKPIEELGDSFKFNNSFG